MYMRGERGFVGFLDTADRRVVVFVLPALALAYWGKLLWLAALLASVPVLVALRGHFS
jgi:hypothetical protein